MWVNISPPLTNSRTKYRLCAPEGWAVSEKQGGAKKRGRGRERKKSRGKSKPAHLNVLVVVVQSHDKLAVCAKENVLLVDRVLDLTCMCVEGENW
jgi:hypothetical protein